MSEIQPQRMATVKKQRSMYLPPTIAPEDTHNGHAIELPLGDWAYALDDGPGVYGPGWYPFHEHVWRREPVPNGVAHTSREVRTPRTRLRMVRISPDKAFYSWGNEYVLLQPYLDDSRVTARTSLYVKRATSRRTEIGVDLREKAVIIPDGCPENLLEQAQVKGQRILDFLLRARSERRRGRPAPHEVLHKELRPKND